MFQMLSANVLSRTLKGACKKEKERLLLLKTTSKSHKVQANNTSDLPDALARTDDGHEMGLPRTKQKVINIHTSCDLLSSRSTQRY